MEFNCLSGHELFTRYRDCSLSFHRSSYLPAFIANEKHVSMIFCAHFLSHHCAHSFCIKHENEDDPLLQASRKSRILVVYAKVIVAKETNRWHFLSMLKRLKFDFYVRDLHKLLLSQRKITIFSRIQLC